MFNRPFWISRIESAWRKKPIVWLSGVRRAGKTTLASMLPDTRYVNCDLPSTARALKDPELFLDAIPAGQRLVFDEIHRLDDPASVLKIASDAYPHLRVLATGSSTLAATAKFRDSLTGRKTTIHLPPVLWSECRSDAKISDLGRRLLHGGLPQQLLADKPDSEYFSEWLDSFYARDIQELFNVRNRHGFMMTLRLLLRQSGCAVSVATLATECEISRPTVISYIDALELSHAITVVRPFHAGNKRELTRQPRYYGFDTGFVCHEKGWDSLRGDDMGVLWEHVVLDTLCAMFDENRVSYWRDKSDHEIDFIVNRGHAETTAVECKINPDKFSVQALAVFRQSCPEGANWVISPGVKTRYRRRIGGFEIDFLSLEDLTAF